MDAVKRVCGLAFRLEVNEGIVDVDGEAIECEALQVQVHKGLLRIFS